MIEAFKLMIVGMGTVFLILIMVVQLGNLIIRITNNFATVPLTLTKSGEKDNSGVDSVKLAVLVSVVDITTKGKGKISSIEKIK